MYTIHIILQNCLSFEFSTWLLPEAFPEVFQSMTDGLVRRLGLDHSWMTQSSCHESCLVRSVGYITRHLCSSVVLFVCRAVYWSGFLTDARWSWFYWFVDDIGMIEAVTVTVRISDVVLVIIVDIWGHSHSPAVPSWAITAATQHVLVQWATADRWLVFVTRGQVCMFVTRGQVGSDVGGAVNFDVSSWPLTIWCRHQKYPGRVDVKSNESLVKSEGDNDTLWLLSMIRKLGLRILRRTVSRKS